MIIYPAIGLRCGQRVRMDAAHTGEATIPDEADPVHMAQRLVERGAEWVHLTNLDGALGVTNALVEDFLRPKSVLIQHPGASKPETPHEHALRKIPAALKSLYEINKRLDVSIQIMGGLRTFDDIRLAFKMGAQRVILDMDVAGKPELIDLAIRKWGAEKVSVAVGRESPWRGQAILPSVSDDDTLELGHYLHALGVRTIVYIPEQGPCSSHSKAIDLAARIGDNTGLKVILDSAITGLGDIRRVKSREHFNLDGVVVADTTCTSQLDLRAAVDLARLPLRQRSAGIVPYRMGAAGPEFLILFNLFSDQWQFPRGGARNDEDARKDAIRGFCKETGLPVLHLHDDQQITLQYTATIRNYSIQRTIVYYLAEVGSEEIRLGHENHCEARWTDAEKTWELLTETSPEQLPALDMALTYFSGVKGQTNR